MGVKSHTKQIMRVLQASGIPPPAGRVKKRLLRAYRATPSRLRRHFDPRQSVQVASQGAVAAFWGRMSDVERAKYVKKAGKNGA